MAPLTPSAVYEALKQVFPAQNDDYECSYTEELQELNDFGISTEEQLLNLLRKRKGAVMEIDRSPMNQAEIQMHSADGKEEFSAARIRKGYWFSYPALLRIALELEFGEAYIKYGKRRDGIT